MSPELEADSLLWKIIGETNQQYSEVVQWDLPTIRECLEILAMKADYSNAMTEMVKPRKDKK